MKVRASVALRFTFNPQPSTLNLRRPHQMQFAIGRLDFAQDIAMHGTRSRERNKRGGHVAGKLFHRRSFAADHALRRRVDDEEIDARIDPHLRLLFSGPLAPALRGEG